MEMEKAYELGALGKALKEKGLIEVEDAAGAVYVVIKEWIAASALKSENPYDDLAVPFLKQLDPIVLPQIDKIDGIVGN